MCLVVLGKMIIGISHLGGMNLSHEPKGAKCPKGSDCKLCHFTYSTYNYITIG